MFTSSDLISMVNFLPVFQMSCDTNGTHKEAAMCLFHFFMKDPAAAALNAQAFLTSLSYVQQEGKQTSYCQVANYFLAPHTTDDNIAKSYIYMINFK